MGYKQPSNPMKMMKSALKMHKAEKKAGMHRESAMYMGHSPMEMGHSPMEMGHSPMEMGHSPMEMGHESPAKNVNKGYGYEVKSPMKRESVKQEKKDLLKYNPVDDRSGSPAKAAKPDYIDIDGDGNKKESMKEAAKDKKGSPAKKYDRVVLGGNKGDKSKTKPGKKDYKK